MVQTLGKQLQVDDQILTELVDTMTWLDHRPEWREKQLPCLFVHPLCDEALGISIANINTVDCPAEAL